jgi:hypothetical protein
MTEEPADHFEVLQAVLGFLDNLDAQLWLFRGVHDGGACGSAADRLFSAGGKAGTRASKRIADLARQPTPP